MRCEKCKSEILDDTQQCPMCDVDQLDDDRRNSEVNEAKGDKRVVSKETSGVVVAIISVLVTLAVLSIGFVLFHVIDFENIGRNQGNNDSYFFLNQMNYTTSWGSYYVTEDSIYISFSNEKVYVFDHDFNQKATLSIYDEWWERVQIIYVTEEAIYFDIRQFASDAVAYLYRYDRETSENQLLKRGVDRLRIVDDKVFYLADTMEPSNLYVLDLVDDEASVLFEGEVSRFFINPADETVILIDSGSILQIDSEGNILEQLSDSVNTFNFDGENVVWIANEYLSILNLNTREREEFDFNSLGFISITSDYIIINELSGDENEMHLIDRENPSNSGVLAANVFTFAVVGDYIIYEGRDTHNIYVMDYDGNSRLLIENDF